MQLKDHWVLNDIREQGELPIQGRVMKRDHGGYRFQIRLVQLGQVFLIC